MEPSFPFAYFRGGMKQLGNLVRSVNAAKDRKDTGEAGTSRGIGKGFTEEQPTLKSSTRDLSHGNSIMTIKMDADAIMALAEEVAGWKDPFDVCIWLWAEAELRLKNAYITSLDEDPGQVIIDVSKVVDVPRKEPIEELAKIIASWEPTLMEAHWYLAERLYLYNRVKAIRQA